VNLHLDKHRQESAFRLCRHPDRMSYINYCHQHQHWIPTTTTITTTTMAMIQNSENMSDDHKEEYYHQISLT
jgi:hypothetical protein